ncbi:MAG: hypothetical protein ABI671_15545 [Burkholderiales bacterium]
MLARYSRQLESASMALMMFGIVALCQPWVEVLHRYSILLIIIGLVAFNVFSRIQPAPRAGSAEGH